jgi:hypothetical protein
VFGPTCPTTPVPRPSQDLVPLISVVGLPRRAARARRCARRCRRDRSGGLCRSSAVGKAGSGCGSVARPWQRIPTARGHGCGREPGLLERGGHEDAQVPPVDQLRAQEEHAVEDKHSVGGRRRDRPTPLPRLSPRNEGMSLGDSGCQRSLTSAIAPTLTCIDRLCDQLGDHDRRRVQRH